MYEDKLEFCANLKTEYYKRNIKTLYSWSYETEENVFVYLNALGMNDYKDAIVLLLAHKAHLDHQINRILDFLQDCTNDEDRENALNQLKVILVVCNKTQAIKIYSRIGATSEDVIKDLETLETF